MRIFKHIYYHNNAFLCEEYISDSIEYKVKLDMEMSFYLQGNSWSTEYDFFPGLERQLDLKMKMWKMDGTDIHYKSYEVIKDKDFVYEEW